MDTTTAQLAYFRLMGEREFDVPGKGARRFTPTTMKAWLYRYRKNGFAGITPKIRKDLGGFRVITEKMKGRIKQLRQENLEQSCVKFYDLCLREKALGEPPMCMETLRRYLKSENLYRVRHITPRKRFEMSYFGELWTCDFMHGPQVMERTGAGFHHAELVLLLRHCITV